LVNLAVNDDLFQFAPEEPLIFRIIIFH